MGRWRRGDRVITHGALLKLSEPSNRLEPWKPSGISSGISPPAGTRRRARTGVQPRSGNPVWTPPWPRCGRWVRRRWRMRGRGASGPRRTSPDSVEEVSRAVEYLQLVAAAAVDRTRKQSAAAAAGAAAGAVTGWTTGWRESPAGWQTGAPGTAEPAGASLASAPAARPCCGPPARPCPRLPPARLLRRRPPEAPERVSRRCRNRCWMTGTGTRWSSCGRGCGSAPRRPGAGSAWPTRCCPGRDSPAGPCRPCTRSSEPPSRPARSRPAPRPSSRSPWTGSGTACLPEAAAAMEHALTRTAAENDADFLARVSPQLGRGAGPGRRRTLRGTAPPAPGRLPPQTPARPAAPGNLRHHGPVRTPDHRDEHRHQPPHRPGHRPGHRHRQHGAGRTGRGRGGRGGAAAARSVAAARVLREAPAAAEARPTARKSPPRERTRAAVPGPPLPAAKLLDGLVGACKAALATGGLPAAGGLRPQVMATIDYRDLLTRLGTTPAEAGAPANTAQHARAPGRCCSPAPSPPAPSAKSPATPTSSPSSSAARARSWTSAAPPASSRPTSARPSRPGTGAAPSRNAPSRHPGARPTTSPTGPAAEPPEPATEPCSAPITTT